ncbi:sugar ABC transporter ATP-binding protein [Chitinimonas sp. BJB300]|uniref:sugar ABC transporter ATP-binding protein n=1 Tax=Chitinimonas sp. BJB300 TaxID=1559339 RepID=UPI000C10EB43|nr:sugar ABC transporter ATP-binding protein [Chitinimonas sp. BJB300]PHV11705.1 sugar ABC transporter ATP-binding protein [Chitinimonas sp. BJB300]TSJ88582.1 sugar ABC transporter ATP-binding protein [Chitinimonas sp. BJB300]
MTPPTPLLRVTGISKHYATPVLSDIALDLHAGEVLALTGENGAGKSTLSKIICGLVQPTTGTLTLTGQPFQPASRSHAERLGVRMVMQELSLIPTLSVAENLLLDKLPHRFGMIDQRALYEQAKRQMAVIGLDDIDPGVLVGSLGIGHQQMVEIARNLVGDCKLLILDEPTAMLTDREIAHLFEQIARLKARGVGIVYISHRLDELQRIADRVAVLRDGRLVDVRPMADVTQDELVQRMVGHVVDEGAQRPRRVAGAVRLEVRGLHCGEQVQAVDLSLHAGEIMGLAGLVGAGRTELLRLIFGADRKDGGELFLDRKAQPVTIDSPMTAIRHGIGLVTEDRKAQGLLLNQSIRVNTTLANLAAVNRRGWLNYAEEHDVTRRLTDILRVKYGSVEQVVGELSGGNQQKVVFARWLHRDCNVLLLDEPTRGVDIGARADLYQELDRLAADGKAMLMVSSDLRELMTVCDRIGVMSAGRLVGVFERGEWTEQILLEACFSGYANLTPTPQSAAASL